MKTLLALLALALLTTLTGCVGTATAPTPIQLSLASAVEDAISIGLVPVLSKNPGYAPAASAVAAALGSFAGDTLTPDDVRAFLAKTSLTPDDQRVVAGIVNAAWSVFTKRYAERVGAATRPDVKLFLAAVADGIKSAVSATPVS